MCDQTIGQTVANSSQFAHLSVLLFFSYCPTRCLDKVNVDDQSYMYASHSSLALRFPGARRPPALVLAACSTPRAVASQTTTP